MIVVIISSVMLGAYTPQAKPRYTVDPNYINYPGKIWLYGNILLVNDKYTGVHFFDISNPASPQKLHFLVISNNIDIAVKDNILYADSYGHLLSYDISVITNPVLVDIQSNAVGFPINVFSSMWLGDDMMYDGWGLGCSCPFALYDAPSDSGISSSQGGSTARFTVAGNVLYTLKDGMEIQAFDITSAAHPVPYPAAAISQWDAQTLFPYQNKLFIGTMNGMLIYDISDPVQPTFINAYTHVRAYDPVIVQSNVAYFTLQSASEYPWNRLEAVYLNDYTNFEPLAQTAMYSPMGLGAQGDNLYVCDGYQGLARFDISDYNQGVWNHGIGVLGYPLDTYAYDVIPFSQYLIISGNYVQIAITTNQGTPQVISTLY